MTVQTYLSKQMRALADTGHDQAVELRARADALDAALDGYRSAGTVSVHRYAAILARARSLWRDVSTRSR